MNLVPFRDGELLQKGLAEQPTKVFSNELYNNLKNLVLNNPYDKKEYLEDYICFSIQIMRQIYIFFK